MSKIEAMILAAGKGTRMRAHNSSLPKPLVQIAGKPLIDYALDVIKRGGLAETVVNIHHLGEQLEHYLGGKSFDITLSREEELLETGGGIKLALPLLAERFFTFNSDVICVETGGQSVIERMKAHWIDSQMDSLMLLCPLERAVGYVGQGDFSLSAEGRLQPRIEGQPAYVYMGIQQLHQRFLDDSPEGAFSLSQLYKQEVAKGDKCRLFGLVHDGSWLHVGDPEGVALAENYLAAVAA